jgi:hypothetical protein
MSIGQSANEALHYAYQPFRSVGIQLADDSCGLDLSLPLFHSSFRPLTSARATSCKYLCRRPDQQRSLSVFPTSCEQHRQIHSDDDYHSHKDGDRWRLQKVAGLHDLSRQFLLTIDT